jgi:hypothetical protein
MLLLFTASLAIGVLGVNAGYPQCRGSNPNPTGQGFGAILDAKATWLPGQGVCFLRVYSIEFKLKYLFFVAGLSIGTNRWMGWLDYRVHVY